MNRDICQVKQKRGFSNKYSCIKKQHLIFTENISLAWKIFVGKEKICIWFSSIYFVILKWRWTTRRKRHTVCDIIVVVSHVGKFFHVVCVDFNIFLLFLRQKKDSEKWKKRDEEEREWERERESENI
jgi:hypothetical protein